MGSTPSLAGLPEGTVVEIYKSDLDFPVDMIRVPGSRKIFFTEKMTGKIRVLRGRRLLRRPCANLRVYNDRERGAAGITLDPDYIENRYLYVYFQSRAHDDNRVVRFTVAGNLCTERTVIIEGIEQAPIHNGGQLEFLDGYLFVSTGDAEAPASAQDTTGLSGKILRIYPDGSIPEDNPFPEEPLLPRNPVWSYGHRNPYGLAVRPETSQLFESENGPTCDDEVNFIQKGANYGWGIGDTGQEDYPRTYCDADAPQPTEPLWDWGEGKEDTIAPTDMVWYRGPVDAADDRLLMGDFKGGDLHAFRINREGEARRQKILYDGARPIFDVARGPGGWVYLLRPNAILRIVEAPSAP